MRQTIANLNYVWVPHMRERKDLNEFLQRAEMSLRKCLMTSECRAKIPKRWSILFSTAAALTELVQYLQLVESVPSSYGKTTFRPIPVSTQSLWWQRKRQSMWVSLNSGRDVIDISYIHEKKPIRLSTPLFKVEQRTLLSAQWSGALSQWTMTRSVECYYKFTTQSYGKSREIWWTNTYP